MLDAKAMAEATAIIVREAVDKATTPLLARRNAARPPGRRRNAKLTEAIMASISGSLGRSIGQWRDCANSQSVAVPPGFPGIPGCVA